MGKSHHRGLARTPELERPKGRPFVVSFVYRYLVSTSGHAGYKAACPQSETVPSLVIVCFTIYRGLEAKVPEYCLKIHF